MMVMKRFLFLVLLTASFGIISFQAKAEVSIAVVDVQKLMTESKAAQSIQKQAQTEREKLQGEFAGYEQKLKDSEKKLVDQKNDLSPEEFAKKRDEFQKQLQETGGLVQKKKRLLETALVKGTNNLRGEILKIVAKVSEEKGYDLVLTRQNIVIVAKEYDITAEIMDKLNASMSSIPLELK